MRNHVETEKCWVKIFKNVESKISQSRGVLELQHARRSYRNSIMCWEKFQTKIKIICILHHNNAILLL